MTSKIIILLCLLAVKFCGVVSAGQVNVFIYHRFDETRYPSTNISTDTFREQLEYLKQNNIEVLPLSEVVRRLRSGDSLPDSAAALTIDDAFSSFYTSGMPLLREYGYPATLFINSDAVSTSGYMNWDQIREVVADGIEIGHHTASHPYLVEKKEGESDLQWQQRMQGELSRASEQFKTELGLSPELFAYTFGEYSAEVMALVKDSGFSAAFAQQSGVIHDESELFALPRFPMGGPFATLAGFVQKLKMQALKVQEVEPADPVVGQNPPVLTLKLQDPALARNAINCFVQGDNSCRVNRVAGQDGWIEITAEKPLSGRRNKYTLTVQTQDGSWAWYSHLWINASNPARFAEN